MNEEHYTAGGPVFVIASGESSGQGIADHLVFNSSGSFGHLLKEFHGMGLVWEHRYVKPIILNASVLDSVDISAGTMETPFRFLSSKTLRQSI